MAAVATNYRVRNNLSPVVVTSLYIIHTRIEHVLFLIASACNIELWP